MANYDSDSTNTILGVLAQTETLVATRDASTPAGQFPTVVFNLAGAASTFAITSSNGAYTTVNQTVNVANTLNLAANGGTLVVGTGVAGLDTVNATISNGGTYVLGGTVASLLGGGTITYGTGGGTVSVGTAGTFVGLSMAPVFYGLTATPAAGAVDRLDDNSLNYATLTGYTIGAVSTAGGVSTQTITFNDSSGAGTITIGDNFLTAGTYAATAGPLHLSADAAGGSLLSVCFLRGTRIATPQGETAVETLRIGDQVATVSNGAIVYKPVVWLGSRRMRTAPGGPIENHPVRIRAGAFRDAVPHRDLLVTPEHCLFVDGRLIPARMLVNGTSILSDLAITDYEYFHVELDAHSILLAEGLESESYLDTGNRGNFAGAAMALHPVFSVDATHRNWATDAAAPLAVDRPTVEPIWAALATRAASLGLGASPPPRLTDAPDLRLVADGGIEIAPVLFDGTSCAFVVPTGLTGVRLVSRTARPSETIGPFLDDRRALGVRVGRIGVGDGRSRTPCDLHLTVATLPGWHAIEGQDSRWTDGNALLPIDFGATQDRLVRLDIEIIQAGPYLDLAPVTPLRLAA